MKNMLRCAIIGLGLVALMSAGAWAAGKAGEGDLVQTAGWQYGLALHLGAGSKDLPDLTADLAARTEMLVHGLAWDAEACERARAAIAARKVTGRAKVEYLAPAPLPYLSDMANLVVVDDLPAVTAHGISQAELMRVLAPGGALCVREGGTWRKTLKPRSKDMDDWTHPAHGPDGNMVSEDKVVKFPLGFRWLDGVPVNVNKWAGVRGWVVSNGRVFTLGSTELENCGIPQSKGLPHYLAARDAWNGLPLWKINLETVDNGAFLTWQNSGPLVADAKRVYAVKKDQVIGVDAATGKIELTLPTKYAPARLLLLDDVLVACCWHGREPSKAAFDRDSLWATWVAKGGQGTVEAYDVRTGAQKWSLPVVAENAVAADGLVYLLQQQGNPPTNRVVAAVDLKSGKEIWKKSSTELGGEADLFLSVAGKGYCVVARRKASQLLGLSAKDGKVLYTIGGARGPWAPIVEGALWSGAKQYDPLTGEVKGALPVNVGGQGCTPSVIVNHLLTQSRGCGYQDLGAAVDEKGKAKGIKYTGARGACMEGMVPANGMFYTAQNNCRCSPGQVYGFIALGPNGAWPTKAQFEAKRSVETGPAYGQTSGSSPTSDDWPMYRHDAERSAATAVNIPEKLVPGWRTAVTEVGEGRVSGAWQARISSCLTAPVVADNRVFVAASDEGQVVSLDAKGGAVLWRKTLGSRIDTPPAVCEGLCVVGCHDGYVYALRATDGALAWRVRIAPEERRMVAFGMVESLWPVVGAVLVHNGAIYVTAGRTSESDGGLAVVALEPRTGKQLWAREIGEGASHMNDILRLDNGRVRWYLFDLDPKTGAGEVAAKITKDMSQGGLMDGTWTMVGKRRAGNAFQQGKLTADLLAWNESVIAAPGLLTSPENARQAADSKSVAATVKAALPRNLQVEALALAGNAMLRAGRDTAATGKAQQYFLNIVALDDGRTLGEFKLDAPPTYDGLAIANNRVLLSLQNGTLLSFEAKKP